VRPSAENADDQPQSPEELRQEIQQTREELGDTVEALAEKTDLKAQAKDRVAAVKESAQQKGRVRRKGQASDTPVSGRWRTAGHLHGPARTTAVHGRRSVRGRSARRLGGGSTVGDCEGIDANRPTAAGGGLRRRWRDERFARSASWTLGSLRRPQSRASLLTILSRRSPVASIKATTTCSSKFRIKGTQRGTTGPAGTR
jgi:hypothetical protein